jgi:hypothetical protein
MKHAGWALILSVLACPAWADYEDYRHGRVRDLDPGVLLQRADETSAEDAIPNLPFLPGDRVWTDADGRVEFQFADGSTLRLDSRSKLDYLAHDDTRQGDLVALSLWSGSLYLHVRDDQRRSDFDIETPGGRVELRDGGIYRLDLERGELRLSVFEGEATLDSGRRVVSVRRGERAYAARGQVPSRPERFDRQRSEDDFARWDRERAEARAYAGDSRRYLPEDVLPYAGDFDAHGDWSYELEVGYVWRPRVSAGWRPYVDGRWVWTAYGWTWVPYERWGWAPFHFGRWGHSRAAGWYWIPGRQWGPAWVSWAVGSDYVGWCPLGHRDRPVRGHWDAGRYRGRAVPRDNARQADGSAWTYLRRSDLGAHDVARRRLQVGSDQLGDLRPLEVGRTRLTRELRPIDQDAPLAPRGALPRNVRTRPSPGDSVPELRADPQLTIPSATGRRGLDGRPEWRSTRERATPREGGEREWDDSASRGSRAWPRSRGGSDTWRSTDERERSSGDRTERDPATTDDGGARRRPPEPESGRDQGERDVLRRLFRPLMEDGARDTERSARPRGDDGRPAWRTPARGEPERERSGGAQPSWRAPEPERRAPAHDRGAAPVERAPAPREGARGQDRGERGERAVPRPPRD